MSYYLDACLGYIGMFSQFLFYYSICVNTAQHRTRVYILTHGWSKRMFSQLIFVTFEHNLPFVATVQLLHVW